MEEREEDGQGANSWQPGDQPSPRATGVGIFRRIQLDALQGDVVTTSCADQVLANLWFTSVERRWGDLKACLASDGIDALELQRRADISHHAAEALLNPALVEFALRDVVFFHVNAKVICEGKKIKLPRTSMGNVTEVTNEGLVVNVFHHPEGVCPSNVLTSAAVLKKIDVGNAKTADPTSEAALRYRVYMFLKDLSKLHLLPVPSNQGFGPLASLVDGFRGLRALGLPKETNVQVYADDETFDKMKRAFPNETEGWEQDSTNVDWATAEDWEESEQCKINQGIKLEEWQLAFSSQFGHTIPEGRSLIRLKNCIQNTFGAANFVAAGPYSWINQNRPLVLTGDILKEAAIPFNSVWQSPVRFEELSPDFKLIVEATCKQRLIELIVNYGLHTLHQVEDQRSPKFRPPDIARFRGWNHWAFRAWGADQ
jgi:hypothetical protein